MPILLYVKALLHSVTGWQDLQNLVGELLTLSSSDGRKWVSYWEKYKAFQVYLCRSTG